VADQQEGGYTDDEPLSKSLADHATTTRGRPMGPPPNPYVGSTVMSPAAGVRTESTTKLASEHRDGGMFGGGRVVIHLRSERGKTTHECEVLDFLSVPAPHLLVRMIGRDKEPGRRRIFFTSAIDWIDPVEYT
jgi:hypothetical protein